MLMKDLSGKQFGRLTVNHLHGSNSNRVFFWSCICSCGKELIVPRNNLTSGNTRSCGCLRNEKLSERRLTHGMTGHPLHIAWTNIRARCSNKKIKSYKDYGAKGVKVCERWQTFDAFYSDMGPTWYQGLTIERKDVLGDYEPENCIWATRLVQGANKRNTVYVDSPWGRIHASEAARRLGIGPANFLKRQRKWPIERLFEPRSDRGPKPTRKERGI
jgi:hypothetical protein